MNENIDKIIKFSRDILSEKIKIDSKSLVDELEETVRFHEWRYYTLNEPILSDTEYDFLFKALETVEKSHPAWRSAHSPTQRVGLEITENAKQIDHLQPISMGGADLMLNTALAHRKCNVERNVPSRIRDVRAPSQDSGVNASEP